MKALWNKWKELAEKIGDFQAKLVFSLLYFLIVTPVGLVSSIFKDFLELTKKPQWHTIDDSFSTLEKMKEQ